MSLLFSPTRFLLLFRSHFCRNCSFTRRYQHDSVLELFPHFGRRTMCSSGVNSDLGECFFLGLCKTVIASIDLWRQGMFTFENACKWSLVCVDLSETVKADSRRVRVSFEACRLHAHMPLVWLNSRSQNYCEEYLILFKVIDLQRINVFRKRTHTPHTPTHAHTQPLGLIT